MRKLGNFKKGIPVFQRTSKIENRNQEAPGLFIRVKTRMFFDFTRSGIFPRKINTSACTMKSSAACKVTKEAKNRGFKQRECLERATSRSLHGLLFKV